ncbi:MAG: rhomboid family intramembrane serine protease [Candidatus Acidiferrales bacterium]
MPGWQATALLELWPRLRWKFSRARERLRAGLEGLFRREPRPRVCFNCGRLVGANEKVCSHCGTSQGALSLSAFKRLSLAVIPAENPATYGLMFINLVFFVVAWIISHRAGSEEVSAVGVSGRVLLLLGAKSGYHIYFGQEYWRLVMPNFLHFDIYHFAFNSFALWQVGPQVEELFGSRRFLFQYLVTGVAGFALSFWWYDLHGRPVLSAGSSAAIFGLIGVLISYVSQRPGFAREYRASLIRWAVFMMIIGIFLPFDNAAHLGGLLGGLVLGRVVGSHRAVSALDRGLEQLMGWGSVAIILWSIAMVFLHLPTAPR